MLSPEERMKLRGAADNLRTEISDLTAERDAARVANADTSADARLIAEVQALRAQRDAAEKERDAAVNSTDDAIKIMEQVMEAQAATAAQANAGSSSAPVNTDDKVDVDATEVTSKEELTEDAKAAAEAPAEPREPAEVTEATSATKNKGGNR